MAAPLATGSVHALVHNTADHEVMTDVFFICGAEVLYIITIINLTDICKLTSPAELPRSCLWGM